MLRNAYERGRAEALNRFKVANVNCGPAGNVPVPPPAAAAMPATTPKPPSPPNAPVAAGAQKANILG